MKKRFFSTGLFTAIAIMLFLSGKIIPVNDGVTGAVGVAIILFVSIAFKLLFNKFAKKDSEA